MNPRLYCYKLSVNEVELPMLFSSFFKAVSVRLVLGTCWKISFVSVKTAYTVIIFLKSDHETQCLLFFFFFPLKIKISMSGELG